jgi:polar amino acid transport system substrate-binding protein
MSIKNILGVGATIVAATLVLAGCAATSTPTTTAEASKGAIAVDSAAAALLPAEYAKGINIGSDIPYAPMELFDENNNVTGFDYDLSQAIGAKLGVKMDFQKQAWDSIIPSLEAGNHDLIMSGMNDTVERQAKLDFVDYFNGGFSIIVKKGNPLGISKLTDLCDQNVAVQTATAQGDMLKALTPECTKLGKGAVKLIELPTDPDAQAAVRADKAVADVMDAPIAAYAALTAGDGKYFDLIKDAANPNGYESVLTGIGVLKKNTGLRDAVQAAVQSLIDDGNYGKILAKWNLSNFAVSTATINGTK